MNYVDYILLAIIGLCVLNCFRKGLILSLFSLVSWILGIGLTYYFYPIATKFLYATPIYDKLKIAVSESISVSNLFGDISARAQNELINALQVPEMLKKALLENNNPQIYELLHVSSIEDYISSYIASICMNGIAVLGVFIVVMLILNIIAATLNLVSKLPVINEVNKLGGALVGVLQATIFIWIIFTVMVVLFSNFLNTEIFQMINTSVIGKLFFDSNVILKFILSLKL